MKERFMVIVMKERTGGKANENVSKRVILGNVPDIIRADVLPHVHLYNMYTKSSDTYWRVCFEDHDSTGHFRL